MDSRRTRPDRVGGKQRATSALWRIPLQAPERPERLSPPGDECRQPAVAMQQGRLAFTRASRDENIWRLALSAPGRPSGAPVSLTGIDAVGVERAVFAGCDPDRVREPALRGAGNLGRGSGWAERPAVDVVQRPPGRNTRVVARRPVDRLRRAGRRGARGHLRHPGPRRRAVRLTNHPADDLVPSWSRDGRSIYFGSTRTGSYQIWKVSREAASPFK